MRSWAQFHGQVLRGKGNALPPSLDGLLQWSLAFRHPKTFSNYLGYLSLACSLENLSTDVFKHPSLRRAKEAIRKRKLFTKRPKTFIRLALLQRMIPLVLERPQLKEFLMLSLTAYIFLLRVPSEAFPLFAHQAADNIVAPVLSVHADHIKMVFPHRKNSYESSEAVRHCWCSRCALTCPLHVLGAYFKTLAAGTRPFALFKYGQVRIAIHEMMAELGVENPLDYGTHSFRRGHCDDLEQRGGTAAEICAMGSLAPFSR